VIDLNREEDKRDDRRAATRQARRPGLAQGSVCRSRQQLRGRACRSGARQLPQGQRGILACHEHTATITGPPPTHVNRSPALKWRLGWKRRAGAPPNRGYATKCPATYGMPRNEREASRSRGFPRRDPCEHVSCYWAGPGAISLVILPWTKCWRRVLATVSTISIDA
jgi:hypothetical protein